MLQYPRCHQEVEGKIGTWRSKRQQKMKLDDVSPGEVDFKEQLFASDRSVIFLIVVRGQRCVMKVVSNNISLNGPLID